MEVFPPSSLRYTLQRPIVLFLEKVCIRIGEIGLESYILRGILGPSIFGSSVSYCHGTRLVRSTKTGYHINLYVVSTTNEIGRLRNTFRHFFTKKKV